MWHWRPAIAFTVFKRNRTIFWYTRKSVNQLGSYGLSWLHASLGRRLGIPKTPAQANCMTCHMNTDYTNFILTYFLCQTGIIGLLLIAALTDHCCKLLVKCKDIIVNQIVKEYEGIILHITILFVCHIIVAFGLSDFQQKWSALYWFPIQPNTHWQGR